MDENNVISLIAMETTEPKRKMTRSAGSVYIILIAMMIGTISLANLLYERWQVPRYAVQPAIYILIAAGGFLIYRRHMISYRYTLTDRMFAIERITPSKEQTIVAAQLEHILRIEDTCRTHTSAGNCVNASRLPRKLSKMIFIEENEEQTSYRISPSADFFQKLITQREVVKQKEGTQPIG